MMPTGVSPSSICYVHCSFCNTMLAVNVPGNNWSSVVAVKCGHCSNLLSVNVGDLLPTLPNMQELKAYDTSTAQDMFGMECGSTSMSAPTTTLLLNTKAKDVQEQMVPVKTSPEKRQRMPSAYNRFIKEEIQRIKANNPEISHRQAFSTAAKNWAHLPSIHFGLTSDGNKQPANIEEHAAGDQIKAQSFFQ